MAGRRPAAGPLKALLVALPFALVLAWTLPTQGPSRAELARALSRDGDSIAPSDIESIRCAAVARGVVQDCRWRQHGEQGWRSGTGRLAATAEGWLLVAEEGRSERAD